MSSWIPKGALLPEWQVMQRALMMVRTWAKLGTALASKEAMVLSTVVWNAPGSVSALTLASIARAVAAAALPLYALILLSLFSDVVNSPLTVTRWLTSAPAMMDSDAFGRLKLPESSALTQKALPSASGERSNTF